MIQINPAKTYRSIRLQSLINNHHIVHSDTSARAPHIRLSLPANNCLENLERTKYNVYIGVGVKPGNKYSSKSYLRLLERVKPGLKSILELCQMYETFRRNISLLILQDSIISSIQELRRVSFSHSALL